MTCGDLLCSQVEQMYFSKQVKGTPSATCRLVKARSNKASLEMSRSLDRASGWLLLQQSHQTHTCCDAGDDEDNVLSI